MNDEHQIEEKDDAIIGVAFKWSLVVILLIAAIVAGVLFLNREKPVEEAVVERETIAAPEELNQETGTRQDVSFTAKELGFVHNSGAQGEKLLPECMGSGTAVFDYNGDGHMDILFVNGTHWSHNQPAGGSSGQFLYENDGKGNFTDVSKAAGLDVSFYAMGAAVGDIDNDGDPDLFFSAVGKNRFFRNHQSVFKDETDSVGLAGPEGAWSSSAGFFDYDNDSDLDLFVCNYVTWTRKIDMDLNFTLNGKDRAYGPPTNYAGADSMLFRNDGGKFTDVSAEAGIQVQNPSTNKPMGKALAVTFADVDRDGRLDILVANDTVQNFVFQNMGDGKFEEVGILSGIAFDGEGNATGAMGMDATYYANDDRMALGIANFANESSSLYIQQNEDPWFFVDMANSEGVGSPSRLKLSFGLFFFDYDLDGRQDMLQANGHLEDEINEVQPSQHYEQAAQLFWNTGAQGGAYALVPEATVGDLAAKIVGRGAAYGDFDSDGDLDLVLTQTGGAPLVLSNDQDLGNHWLRVKLTDNKGARDAYGARVAVTAGGVTQTQTLMPTRSYLSQVEPILTFGLGKNTAVTKLAVTWPDGQTQEVTVDSIDQLLAVVRN